MSPLQLLIAHAVKVAVAATLAGLLVRRRWRLCLSFVAYLVAILVCNALITLWPDRFYRAWFYTWKESAYDVLKLAIAAELAWRMFRAFPGALARVRLVLAAILVATALVVVYTPPGASYEALLLEPQAGMGAIWVLTAVALIAHWYRIPQQPFHRALLYGLVSYLLVFVTGKNVLRDFGFERQRQAIELVDGVAYLAVATWWAWAAWRPARALEISPTVARRLGMEAA